MSDTAAYRTLAVRLRAGSSVPKHLYIKSHSSKDADDSLPKGHALFVAGLPLQLDEGRLQQLFEVFGAVTTVRTASAWSAASANLYRLHLHVARAAGSRLLYVCCS